MSGAENLSAAENTSRADKRPTAPEPASSAAPASRGFRIVLVAVYGIFALSATARSLVQIVRDFDAAPLAYALSCAAALTYLALTVLLARRRPRTGWILALVGLELAGVLVVGTLSITHPELFADDTVWSHFGAGYGYVPLALPLIAGTSVLVGRSRLRTMAE